MLITLFILFAWTVSCWFTQFEAEPFLGIPFLSMEVAVPFWIMVAAALVFAVIKLVLMVRSGDLSGVRQYLRIRLEILVVFAIVSLFMISQAPSSFLYRATNDSDSAMYGVASYHIARGEERPMWFYGKHYNGTVTPHLAAGLHLITGLEPANLRIANTLQYACFILFLYLTVRRLGSRAQATWSAIIAALPAFYIHHYINNTYFASVVCFGTWGTWLLVRALQREQQSWRDYFWVGAIFGIGFFAHLQLIFFIGTACLIMLISGKRHLLSPHPWAAIPGFFLGSIPTWIDSYYYDFIIFKRFFSQAGEPKSMFSQFTTGVSEFLRCLGDLFGGTTIFGQGTALGQIVEIIDIVIVLIVLAAVAWVSLPPVLRAFKGKDVEPGPILFVLFFLVTALLFSVSDESSPPAPSRYIAPVWYGVAPLLVFGASTLIRNRKALHVSLAVYAAFLALSQVVYIQQYSQREADLRRWEEFCRFNNISRYYGDFWTTYNGNFFTREEIIGTCVYDFFEAYPPYYYAVADSGEPAVYHFRWESRKYREFTHLLGMLGVTYNRYNTPYGFFLMDFSQPISQARLRNLWDQRYSAEISDVTILPVAFAGQNSLIASIEATIRNTGEAEWTARKPGGYLRLSALSSTGAELAGIYLPETVGPGAETRVAVLVDQQAMDSEEIQLAIDVNGIAISEAKTLSISESPPDVEPLPDAYYYSGTVARDALFQRGWLSNERQSGKTIRIAAGGQSLIRFPASGGAGLELELKLRELEPDGPAVVETTQIDLFINGHLLAEKITAGGKGSTTLRIAAGRLRQGLNELQFSYQPVEPGYHRDLDGSVELNHLPRGFILRDIRLRKLP